MCSNFEIVLPLSFFAFRLQWRPLQASSHVCTSIYWFRIATTNAQKAIPIYTQGHLHISPKSGLYPFRHHSPIEFLITIITATTVLAYPWYIFSPTLSQIHDWAALHCSLLNIMCLNMHSSFICAFSHDYLLLICFMTPYVGKWKAISS